jgi:hypothetical protein
MEDCGFMSYDYEWWHYTLKHEPYPNTYFDFPITQSSPARRIPKATPPVPDAVAAPRREP